jgi:hypothetical protein
VKRAAQVALVLATLGRPAAAQTNDHFFRSWRWIAEPSDARGSGLGGAVAALGDDPSAALGNPSGLASLDKSQLQAGLRSRGAGSSAVGDAIDSHTGLGSVVLAWRPHRSLVVAGFVAEPYARGLTLDTPALADGLADRGALAGTVTDLGAAVAWRAAPWLDIGARAAASRLALEGTYTRDPAAGATNLRVDTGGHATEPTGSIGARLALGRRAHLGLVATTGAAWVVTRTAASPVQGVVLVSDEPYEIRAPRIVAAGIALEPSRRLALFGQVDYVAYHDIQQGLVIGQGALARADYQLQNAWEPRVGAELSVPQRTFSLQFRAGVHLQAAGLLRYVGSDPVELAAFAGERRRAVISAGASLVTARWLRFDLGGRFGEQTEVLAGVSARF